MLLYVRRFVFNAEEIRSTKNFFHSLCLFTNSLRKRHYNKSATVHLHGCLLVSEAITTLKYRVLRFKLCTDAYFLL